SEAATLDCAFFERRARKRAEMHTGTADLFRLLDDGHPTTGLGGLHRGLLASRARTDHEHVEPLHTDISVSTDGLAPSAIATTPVCAPAQRKTLMCSTVATGSGLIDL